MAVKFSRDVLRGTNKTQGDFNLAHRFNVEINNVSVGGFFKIDGPEFEFDTVEYEDGDDLTPHYRPGRSKGGHVSLEREWASNPELFNWRKAVTDGQVQRESVSIIFLSDDGVESKRINLFNCFPTKWTGPSMNATQSGHASEKIDLVFEGLEVK